MRRNKFSPTFFLRLALILFVPVALFSYISLMGTMGLSYAVTDDGLQVQHHGFGTLMPAEDRIISPSEITEVRVLEQLPRLRKEVGRNGLRTWVGDFSSDDLGMVKAYILNIRRPIVLVKTSTETILISPEDTETFVQQLRTIAGK